LPFDGCGYRHNLEPPCVQDFHTTPLRLKKKKPERCKKFSGHKYGI
jgi:hypothetical protein